MAAPESPGYMTATPRVAKMSKKPLYIIIVVFCTLIAVLIYSINFLHDPNANKEEERKKVDVPKATEKPLVPSDAGYGLALPKPEEKEAPLAAQPQPADKSAPILKVIVPEKAPAWQQEMENIRRQKMQAEFAALSAPLVAKRQTPAQEKEREAAAVNQRTATRDFQATPSVTDPYGIRESQYDPSADKDKEGFLGRASHDSAWILPHARTAGQPLELKTGTVLPGVMLTGINSDLPGNIIGQVSQNVFDTATGRQLLIPQGSKLFGVYDSRVIYGQERVLIAWNRIIFPDGSAMTLGAMPGADMAGYSGLTDEINNHYLRIFGSALLMSSITGGMAYTMDALNTSGKSSQYGTGAPSVQDEMASAMAAQLGQATLALLQKNLNIKPTLEIRPGYQFNIIVTKDMVFQKPYSFQR